MSDDEIHNTTVRTVLGTSRREHRWDLAHEVDITTALGKSFFDLRRARPMGEEDVEISISCYLGSVELLVPVGTRVTLEGSTFLAGASSDVSGEDDAPESANEGVELIGAALPRLDIAATAVLGRVRVRTPDRPERPRPGRLSRLRRNKKAAATPNKRLAEILAESEVAEPEVTEPWAPAESPVGVEPYDLGQPVDIGESLGASEPYDLGQPVDIGQPAPPPTHQDPVEALIEESNNGPVDVEFARRATDEEPTPPLDDFDPADFPDDSTVAS